MDANELVERVARAIYGDEYTAMVAEARDYDGEPNGRSAQFEVAAMRKIARAALREIVAAAGGVDALEWSAAKVRKDEPATAALLRALAEGGKDA